MTTSLNQFSFPPDLVQIARGLVEPYVEPGESLDDVMAGLEYLAIKRADLKQTAPHSLDLLLAIYLLDLCPRWTQYEYREPFRGNLARARQYLFSGAAAGNYSRLEAGVPNATLLLSFEAVDALHAQEDLEGFLRLPPPTPTP